MHYPIKQLKAGTFKNFSFTKDYKNVKAPSSKYMYNEHINLNEFFTNILKELTEIILFINASIYIVCQINN